MAEGHAVARGCGLRPQRQVVDERVVRHDEENFPGYSREQFIGHGNPEMQTSSNNQLHVQLEKSSAIRTITRDGDDIDRCAHPAPSLPPRPRT